MPVEVRVPKYVTVCGRRVSVDESVRYIRYLEEALRIDVADYCERPEGLTISIVDDYDGYLIRLGVRKADSVWAPAVRRSRSCRETGRRWDRNLWLWLHYTIRYCQRPGSETRNITVDLRTAQKFSEEALVKEYFSWLRRHGVTMRCLRKTPETTQRRLVMMFYVWWLSKTVQTLWRKMEAFLTRCFYSLPYLAPESAEGVKVGRKLPPLQTAYIAWGVTRRGYLDGWVYGMYCRCSADGTTTKCRPVQTPYTRCTL